MHVLRDGWYDEISDGLDVFVNWNHVAIERHKFLAILAKFHAWFCLFYFLCVDDDVIACLNWENKW